MNNLVDIKAKVVDIWERLLDVTGIDYDEEFFVLGGNSLKIIVLQCEIIKEFEIELALEDIFKNQTINKLTKLLYNNIQKNNVNIDIIPKCEKREYYPLSWTQKEKFILDKFIDDNQVFNVTLACELDGQINIKQLEQSLKYLIERHESLRTIFKLEKGLPVQVILDSVDFELQRYNSKRDDLEEMLKSIIKPFDIGNEILFRVALIKLEYENKYVVVMDAHHIILDGYSINIILSDLIKIYEGAELLPLRVQYKDYAVWQIEEFIKTEKMSKIKLFWEEQFKEPIIPVELPKDFQSVNSNYLGDTFEVKLNYDINQRLSNYSMENNVSIYNLILTAYSILLSKYTGQTDILIGSLSMGRNSAYLNETIGDFTKTLPVRFKIKNDIDVKEYIKYVQNLMLDIYDNQDFNFSEIYNKIQVADVMDIFSSVVNYHLETRDIGYLRFKDIEVKKINLDGPINANRDIQLEINNDENDCIVLSFQFNKLRFRRERIEMMSKHFIRILSQIISYENLKIANVKLLSEEEERKILIDFNNTKIKYDYSKTFVELFEDQVELTPNKIAVTSGNTSITYKNLNERANKLARILINQGCGFYKLTGIMVERSINMIIGVLAILKSGSAYVPFDTEYPDERIRTILEDSNINLVVTQKQFKDKFVSSCEIIDIEDEQIQKESNKNLSRKIKSEDLAYVIYTSGTTGKPKGVLVKHENLTNVALSWRDRYKLQQFEVKLLQMASIAFDVFVGDLARTLINGGEMVICPSEVKSDFYTLHSLILKKRISIFESTPALITLFMDFVYENNLEISSLKILIMGSDICAIKEYKKILERYGNKMRVLNSYGVTEATIDSSYYEEEIEKVPNIPNTPIGKPLPNVRFYILDQNKNVQPIGFPGELYIGGAGVTNGYLNRTELTKERFIKDILDKKSNMYKTGDLARWLPDGNVEFLGRIDNQIKIRGFRIELGEIENCILQEEKVDKVVVVEKEVDNEEKYLCAYIIAKDTLNLGNIKEDVKKRVPAYMVPQYMFQVEKLPITFNGKIDVKALPFEAVSKIKEEYSKPSNDVEEKLCDIAEEVLKVNKVGTNDNFFELGGDSLKAILFITKIHKEFNVKISVNSLFENPQIKKLAENIFKFDVNNYSTITHVEERMYYPASSAQKRLYILNKIDNESTSYNIPIAIKIKGALDIEKIKRSFEYLINRHEILRTTFEIKDNSLVQKINKKIDFFIEYDEVCKDDFEFNNYQNKFIKPFDLERGPLFRVKIIKLDSYEFILQIDIHHIISDGQSIEILINEFCANYSGIKLESNEIQYRDFAVWQEKMEKNNALKKQEEYWRNIYKDSIPKLNMPLDYDRGEVQSFEGDKVVFSLDKEIVKRINVISKETGTTLYMFLFAGYAALLANYTQDEDMVIGVPILGRNHSELDQVIGMFVNTLAIRVYPRGDKTFKEFLYDIKNTLLKCYDNADFDLERLIDLLDIDRGKGENPIFDTIFNFRNNTKKDLEFLDISVEILENKSKISKFDFSLDVVQYEDNVELHIEYCTKLFKKETIEKISNYYLELLNIVSEDMNVYINEIQLEDFTNEEIQLDDIEFNF
ncbi:non-ribosomal peptide synthetase [Clostridium felsineum]|uniref:Gramicidin S synthase 2 n=1 Tax=Clostridium felsineum TaxID=36839 RepID=A0A1S8KZN7_9CLOT|nr:non-ribosomal peptide synthetase [Clostridium felsineum]URZ07045.1 Gramicidin S synthase 2 [Clostridium felsineum]URZ12075.1 Gramicidin S synthase 2 [Clostridium felsineum]